MIPVKLNLYWDLTDAECLFFFAALCKNELKHSGAEVSGNVAL